MANFAGFLGFLCTMSRKSRGQMEGHSHPYTKSAISVGNEKQRGSLENIVVNFRELGQYQVQWV